MAPEEDTIDWYNRTYAGVELNEKQKAYVKYLVGLETDRCSKVAEELAVGYMKSGMFSAELTCRIVANAIRGR